MSILTINTHQDDKPLAPSRWRKLQSTWKDIEKKQQRNTRYEEKLTCFFYDFQTQFGHKEAEVCLELEAFAYHLIDFMLKKTITETEIEALHDWIDEVISDLESNPFRQNDISALKKKAHDTFLLSLKEEEKEDFFEALRPHFESMMEDASGEKITLTDEELKRLIKDPDNFMSILTEKLASQGKTLDDFTDEEYSDEDDANDGRSDQADFSNHDDECDENADKFEDFFDTKVMSKLYRQLAKQFHPDKEIEVHKKEDKNKLMQELSKAKKEKDTFAMLLMAQEYLPHFELNLDNAALRSLEMTLKEKISHLNRQHRQMQERNDIVGLVWGRFGRGTKRTQQNKLAEHTQTLLTEKKNIQSQCTSLKTVKEMRKALRLRANSLSFNEMCFDDLFK